MANVLQVVATPGTPNTDDAHINTLLTNAGHTVTYHDDNTTLPASGYAVVVYCESISGSATATTEANATTYPVVYLDTHWNTRLSMASADLTAGTTTQYDITTAGNSHAITSGVSDPATVLSTSASSWALTGTTPAGVTVLATNQGGSLPVLAVADAGGTNQSGGTFPARRVGFGGGGIPGPTATNNWTATMDTLLLNSVTWAIGSTSQNINVGQALEKDSLPDTSEFALPITPDLGGPQNIPVGQAVETDTARVVVKHPIRIQVGQAVTTNTAQAVTAQTVVLPALIDGVEPETHSRVGVIQDSNGNLYRITESFLAENNEPKMMKSTNQGQTWTEQDASRRPGSPNGIADLESMHMTWDSAAKVITITWQRSNVEIAQFNTSDHATNADVWAAWTTDTINHVVTVSPAVPQYASHSKPTDQSYHWVFWSTNGGAVQYCTRAGMTGSSGSTNTLDATGAYPSAVLGPNGTDTYVVYKKSAQVHYRKLTSSGTLDGTSTRVDTSGAADAAGYDVPHAAPVSYTAPNGDVVVSVLFAALNEQLRCVDIVNGTPGSEQTVSTSTVAANEGTTTSLQAICSLTVDGTTLHALWADAATWDVMYSRRAHGGSWSTPVTLYNTLSTPTQEEIAWVEAAIVTHGATKFLGYTYDIGPHADDDSNIYYNRRVVRRTYAVGEVSSTQTAQPITAVKSGQSVSIGIASEADTARSVGKIVRVGQAVESDDATLVVKALSRAAETDAAQPVSRSKRRALAQSTETDAAQLVARSKRRATAFPAETDTAQPITRSKRRAIGIAAETDLSQPVSRSGMKNIPVGQAAETDRTIVVVKVLGRPVESDTALPIRPTRVRTLAQPSDTETATALARVKRRTLAQPSETDQALAPSTSGNKNISVGQVVQPSTAQPITVSKRKTVGQLAETDTTLHPTPTKSRTLSLPASTNTAQPVTHTKRVPVNPATESDAARALAFSGNKNIPVGQATEADTARQVRPTDIRVLAVATTTDTARALAKTTKQRGVAAAFDVETALAIRPQKSRTFAVIVESDTARATGHAKRVTLGVAVVVDVATEMGGQSAPVQVLAPAAALTKNQTAPALTRNRASAGVTRNRTRVELG